jgi:hypothetical protein
MSSPSKIDLVDPFEDNNNAMLVAALPHEFSQHKLERLFARIYRYMNEMEDEDPDELVDGAEEFALAAFRPHKTHNEPGDPLVVYPGMLAVLSVLAATAVMNHDQLEATPPDRVKLFNQIADLYTETLLHQFEAEDSVLNQDLAELIYDNDSLHAGRTCTGIVEDPPGAPDGIYVEIPLVAASKKCRVREADGSLGGGYDPELKESTGELRSHIANNNVYVPGRDLYRRLENQLQEDGFQRLYEAHETFVANSSRRRFLKQESRITERIDRFLKAGQQDLVWADWDPDSRLLRVLRAAVREQEELEREKPYPAKTLYEAMRRFEFEYDWQERVWHDVSNQRSLASRLSSMDADSVEVLETRERKANLYRVGSSSEWARQIEFDVASDIFELPCMVNIDERLMESSPTRKDLYNIVRMLRWLPGYRPDEMSENTFVEEVKQLLSKYPWYDEQTSDYQIRYELRQTNTEGDPYLPIGCNNPDMERYCIGYEECPYSIYGSLPFPDEMYDQIDSSKGAGTR